MAAETQLKKELGAWTSRWHGALPSRQGLPTPRKRSRRRFFYCFVLRGLAPGPARACPRGPDVGRQAAGAFYRLQRQDLIRKLYRAKAKPHAQHAKAPSLLPPPSRSHWLSHRRLSLPRCISRRRHDGRPPLLSAAVPGSRRRRSTPGGPTRPLSKSRPLRRNRPRA